MTKGKIIAILIAVLLVLILLFQNKELITVKFYFWSFTVSELIFLPLLVLGGFIAGFAVAKIRSKKSDSSDHFGS